jgi:hypothetical protein
MLEVYCMVLRNDSSWALRPKVERLRFNRPRHVYRLVSNPFESLRSSRCVTTAVSHYTFPPHWNLNQIILQSLSQAPLENINMTEAGIGSDAGASLPRGLSLQFSPATPIADDCQYPPRTAPNQASQGESGFVDSSGPILSMYLESAKEEDKAMAESWQADAEGILVFVCFHVLVYSLTDSSVVDWFILRRCRIVDLSVDSGPSTEPTGHLQLLPR